MAPRRTFQTARAATGTVIETLRVFTQQQVGRCKCFREMALRNPDVGRLFGLRPIRRAILKQEKVIYRIS